MSRGGQRTRRHRLGGGSIIFRARKHFVCKIDRQTSAARQGRQRRAAGACAAADEVNSGTCTTHELRGRRSAASKLSLKGHAASSSARDKARPLRVRNTQVRE